MTAEEAIYALEENRPKACYAILCTAIDMAIAALRAQAEAEKNALLTFEELLELDGEPVYAECIHSPAMSCYGYIDDITNDFPGVFTGYYADFPVEDYGETWLAYRHKPKGD